MEIVDFSTNSSNVGGQSKGETLCFNESQGWNGF